jgi:hypothetical protein
MQKLGENSPMPGGAHSSSPLPPPIIEPSALRPRSSNPPAEPTVPADKTDVESVYEAKLATPMLHLAPPPALELVPDEESKADKTEPRPPPKVEPTPTKPEPKAEAKPEPKPESKPAKPVVKSEKPPVPKREAPAVSVPQVPKPQGSSPLRWLALAGVLALATFVAVRVSVAPAPVEPAPTGSVAEPPINVLYTDLPPGATLTENEGWLEIHAPEGTVVTVDGIELTSAGAIASGNHELHAGNRTKTVDVRAGKTARVDWP